jgi:hypothetical protein
MPETTDALLCRVSHWSHARVELHDERAMVHTMPDDALVAVVDRETGALALDVAPPAGPHTTEALLRWRVDLAVFDAQARVASP